MEHLPLKSNKENVNSYKWTLNNFEKKMFSNLPNYGTGKFYISEKEINDNFFYNNICENWEETDSDKTDVYFKYKYKTRYSREDNSHIKIDEYTLQRKLIKQKKSEKEKKQKWMNNSKYKKNTNKALYTKYEHNNKLKDAYNIFNINKERDCNNEDNFYKHLFTDHSVEKIESNNVNNFLNIDDLSSYPKFLPYTSNLYENEERQINTEPYRILNAPKLIDDFYYSVLDWSPKNIIAVGLENSLYLRNNNTGISENLCVLSPLKPKLNTNKKIKNRHVTSVKWNKHGHLLAIGTSNGMIEIWEIEKKVRIRKFKNHRLRVGALSWNGDILSSGSKDATIVHCDIRMKENNIITIKPHTLEVCGLQWSPDEQQLASGSNDTSIYIYDKRSTEALFHFKEHKATVKALSWSPHKKNLLISGGGSADKSICFWNTLKGTCINKKQTNSQVCAILWSKNTNEFVSTHSSLYNQIIIWKYPTLEKLSILLGHEKRVLHLALSPDGSTIISASVDEAIKFWNIFPKRKNSPFFTFWEKPHDFIR